MTAPIKSKAKFEDETAISIGEAAQSIIDKLRKKLDEKNGKNPHR
jgi:hypothetical protein